MCLITYIPFKDSLFTIYNNRLKKIILTTLKPHFHLVFWSDSKADFEYIKSELTLNNWTTTHARSAEEMLTLIQNELVSVVAVDERNEQLFKKHQIDRLEGVSIQTVFITDRPDINSSKDSLIVNIGQLIALLKVISHAMFLRTQSPNDSLFQTLLENVVDFIFFKDSNCKYLAVNKSFSEHFEITSEEIIGKTDAELFSNEINITSSESDKYVLEQRKPILFETSYLNSNDKRVILETMKTPVFSNDHDVIGIVGISREITTKKLQEEQVKQEIRLLHESEKLTNSGSFQFTNHGSISVSSNLIQITELNPGGSLRLNDLEGLIHSSDRDLFSSTLKNLPGIRSQSSIEHRIITKKTERLVYCRTTFTIDFNEDCWLIFGTMTDIGDERSNQQAILDAQENERKTLAADLHDSLIQKLVAANMYISALEEELTSLTKQSIAKELVQSAIDETRLLSRNLSLRTIENLGLKKALLEIIEAFPLDAEISYDFEFEEDEVSQNLATQIYRVFQEGIANIMKYSKAKKVWLMLDTNNNGLLLQIQDDGIGFLLDSVKDGNGLKNMRQRIAQINGTFELKSFPGEGTHITIKIPFK